MDAALGARAAESASAAAAVRGVIPLGAEPAVVEMAFSAEVPSSICTPVASAACSLDAIDAKAAAEVTIVRRSIPMRFIGWAGDVGTRTVPPVIFLELDGGRKYYAPAVRVWRRPDVARVLQMPAFTDSSYDVFASLDSVAPGKYAINIVQVNERGTTLRCETRRSVVIP